MHRRVPLARRNLLAEPRRLAASAAGVGMAIISILLLDGLWAGIEANITTYEDNVGADLYVAQPGTRNFFGAISVIPADTIDAVRADPDVDWAASVRFFSVVELHDTKVPTYVIGSTRRPGRAVGPPARPGSRGRRRGRHRQRHGPSSRPRRRRPPRDHGPLVPGRGHQHRRVHGLVRVHDPRRHRPAAQLAGHHRFVLVGTDDPTAVRGGSSNWLVGPRP